MSGNYRLSWETLLDLVSLSRFQHCWYLDGRCPLLLCNVSSISFTTPRYQSFTSTSLQSPIRRTTRRPSALCFSENEHAKIKVRKGLHSFTKAIYVKKSNQAAVKWNARRESKKAPSFCFYIYQNCKVHLPICSRQFFG